MTLQDYIDQVRRVLDEHDTDISFWEDDELIDWLNEAQQEVAKITHCISDRAIISPTQKKEYDLPPDFITEYKVKINDKFVNSIPMVEDGEEEGFYIWGDKIFLSNIDENSEMLLYYYRSAERMEELNDEPEIPFHYHEILIPFALYRAFTKDDKPNKAQLHQQEFMERIRVMKQKYFKEPNMKSWKVIRR